MGPHPSTTVAALALAGALCASPSPVTACPRCAPPRATAAGMAGVLPLLALPGVLLCLGAVRVLRGREGGVE